MRNKIFILLFSCLIVISCEEEITLEMPVPEEKIVVEGYIEIDQTPFVLLTKNAPYFEKVDTSQLLNYLVSGALVTVSDGERTDTLHDYFFPGYYLSTGIIVGKPGKSYSLNVVAEGKTLTATTYIPEPVNKPDSLWYTIKEGYANVVRVWFRYTDPDTIGNYIRIQTRQNSGSFEAFFYSVFEDKFINGKTFEDILRNGEQESCYADNPDADTTKSYVIEECGLFEYGDTVIVKISAIDIAHFKFWQTLEHGKNDGGNPFASPTLVQTNIEGGLGIWGGYGSVYDTLYVY